MRLGDRLRELRMERNLTQGECAAGLNLDQSKYNKWEKGKNRPDYETVCLLASYFNTSTDYLLGMVNVQSIDRVDVGKQTGLSDKAIETLEYLNAPERSGNSVTRAVNALLETRFTLSRIAQYLYYDLKNTCENPGMEDESTQYPVTFCYQDSGDFGGIDPSFTQIIDKRALKNIIFVSLQKDLAALLENENAMRKKNPAVMSRALL